MNKAEIKDFLFGLLKVNCPINFDTIIDKYKAEFAYYNLDLEYLKRLIDELIQEELISSDKDNNYSLTPLGNKFEGFYKGKSIEKRKKRVSVILEISLKIIPIILAIVFGISTIRFNIINIRLKKAETQYKSSIDSLETVVKKQEHMLDSIQKSKNENENENPEHTNSNDTLNVRSLPPKTM